MLDVTASVVVELFERASKPNMPTSETERCKAWWNMLISVSEDVTKLVPIRLLDRLVEDWEVSLVRLRAAYLGLADRRLKEFDAKQEAEQKAAEGEAASKESKKEREAKETKRLDDRKKLIQTLGISPNGPLYLNLTSLLKQVNNRLCSSLHARLRSRIVLLLERLLAMDHKAIANNQKLKTQEYIQAEDLDREAETDAAFAVHAAPAAALDAAPAAEAAPSPNLGVVEGAASLGSDPALDAQFYKSFWGLQESLQYPEKLFDKGCWQPFYEVLSKLLTLFLKYPAPDFTRQPWAPPDPAPLRHAPRARALGVQLDDPCFRQQFLTQALVAFQALENETSTRRTEGQLSKQPDSIKSEFNGLKKVLEAALNQTRKGFDRTLKHILEREAHWVAWKSFGCREFERQSLEMLNGRIARPDELSSDLTSSRSAKPKFEPYISSLLRTLKDPQWKVPAPSSSSDSEAAAKAMRQYSMRGMCDSYLDRLIEEEKPETGIEEEYMARRNKVFMWQTRRLFAHQYLRTYSQKEVQFHPDFMDFVRSAKGLPPKTPPPAPGAKAKEEGEVGATEGGSSAAAEAAPRESTDGGAAAAEGAAAPSSEECGPGLLALPAGHSLALDAPEASEAAAPSEVAEPAVEAEGAAASEAPAASAVAQEPAATESTAVESVAAPTASGTKREAPAAESGSAATAAAPAAASAEKAPPAKKVKT